jgi:hypothetical protein
MAAAPSTIAKKAMRTRSNMDFLMFTAQKEWLGKKKRFRN